MFLPQHKYPLWSSCHTPKTCHQHLHCSVPTLATTTKPVHSRRQQPVNAPLPRTWPPALVAAAINLPEPDDQSLQSTWAHRAWVTSGCTTVLISLAKSMTAAAASQQWLQPVLAGLAGYVLADLGSGIYHWAIDNYGSSSTPMFGSQIEAFQGHHKQPWTITQRQFANNLHALGQSVTIIVLPMDLLFDDPTLLAFTALCSGCIMFSQQFHAWAHSKRRQLPQVVVALQEGGVLISPRQHGMHHRPPYSNNYCIVSGLWNGFLDQQKVFEAMEMMVFFRLGVRPRSWSEPGSEWAQETDDKHSQNSVN